MSVDSGRKALWLQLIQTHSHIFIDHVSIYTHGFSRHHAQTQFSVAFNFIRQTRQENVKRRKTRFD